MSVYCETITNTESRESASKRLVVLEPTLKSLLLCNNVYVDDYGLNTYEGEFKTIHVSSIPAVKKELYVVTKWGDGQGPGLKQEIKIICPENSLEIFSSLELENEFELKNIYHEHVVTGRISDLLLPRAGRYRVEIYLSGQMKAKTHLNVVLSSTPAPL
ncbi:MAG: hypothetical protein ACE5JK_04255 [Candidatus Omnitrophota bacterium]